MTPPPQHPAARARETGALVHDLDPFDLFCAYHLGLTEDGSYSFQNVHDVARRFGLAVPDIYEALRAYGMDPDTLIHTGFDLAGAQADVQLSPEGVDLEVLARMHFETLLEAAPRERDWERELREDAEANRETFRKK